MEVMGKVINQMEQVEFNKLVNMLTFIAITKQMKIKM